MEKLKDSMSLVLLAALLSLLLFWFAENRITFVFSVAAYGYPQNWGYVVLNLVLLGLFILFIGFRKKVARLPASVYLGFIVALYIEMYGFPLTMYIITWFFGISNPGNLWYLLVGLVGKDFFVSLFLGVILPISNAIILLGILLVIFGWKEIFMAKGQFVTTGIYRYVRHPQYLGFLLLTLGMNVLWITLSTFLLWPVLVVLYYRLAKEEDEEMEERFGEEYLKYKHKVPMFIPQLRKAEEST